MEQNVCFWLLYLYEVEKEIKLFWGEYYYTRKGIKAPARL